MSVTHQRLHNAAKKKRTIRTWQIGPCLTVEGKCKESGKGGVGVGDVGAGVGGGSVTGRQREKMMMQYTEG